MTSRVSATSWDTVYNGLRANLVNYVSPFITILFVQCKYACLRYSDKVCVSKHCVFSIFLQLSFEAVAWTQPVCFALQVLRAAMTTTFLLLFLSSAATAISLSLSVCVVPTATNRGAECFIQGAVRL